ncbi:unnamed protein product [Sphenostylis stenocarpa]|uniref:Uncharacterized protein n=1 Tax=Sphenostylis stenocarpa TaxID=92480 RepID=A0AA86VVA6_9FABA|nr:unnamed protein product [Sphenostylis stenocarpa]
MPHKLKAGFKPEDTFEVELFSLLESSGGVVAKENLEQNQLASNSEIQKLYAEAGGPERMHS